MQSGKFAHRNDVAEYILIGDMSVVERHVVGPGKYDYVFRGKLYDIAPEPDQHMGGCLSGYAAAEEIVA